jgi:hypothetical protein
VKLTPAVTEDCRTRKNYHPLRPRFSDSSHYFCHYCTRRQWTVPDSLKNMAFADINEDNISSLLRSKDSKSTQRSVARSIKLFKDYLLQMMSLLLNFYCFSLFAFILFILMLITCIMIRLFYSPPQKISKNTKKITQIM